MEPLVRPLIPLLLITGCASPSRSGDEGGPGGAVLDDGDDDDDDEAPPDDDVEPDDDDDGATTHGPGSDDDTGPGSTSADGEDSGATAAESGGNEDCNGTPDECEAARLINEYRATHVQQGECNHALLWNDELGQLAHDHQQAMGPSIGHSDHGYVENVGYAFGLPETVEWIVEYDPNLGEDHCNPDGSYLPSHHCAAMFCTNVTVGVGVYVGDTSDFGTAYYITMMFGDENGDPDWSDP